jgi:hexosaminidase
MRRPLWTILAGGIALLAAVAVGPLALARADEQAPAAAATPSVVPALREWTAGAGSFAFTTASRVVADSAYASQLGTTAAVLAADLSALTNRTVATVTGTAGGVGTGDILLTLGSTDTALGAQGYQLTVGPSITVQGSADAGVFDGTRTVLQLLTQSRTVPAGTARDWPTTPARGMMVDNGRKYYSTAWLRNQVRQLAYLKFNTLHLHVSDDQGFRIESSTHPEVVSASHYTKAQIADLVAFAARYHVSVVPEIDMPSHMGAELAAHTGYRLVGTDGTVNTGKLDLSQAAARKLATDLVSEYLPLFPGSVWHMGADEYLSSAQYADYPQLTSYAQATYGAGATGQDAMLGFVNTVDSLVGAAGKTLRMWNDGAFPGHNVTLNQDVQIDYWFGTGTGALEFRAAGHALVNSNDSALYYVLGKSHPDPAAIYASFAPNLFQDGSTPPMDGQFLGTSMSIWADLPASETELQVAAAVLPTQQALAQVVWGSPEPAADYAGFQAVATAVGVAPGLEGTSRGIPVTNLPTYRTYLSSGMVDGNPATYFWSSRAVAAGDTVGVDLGAVKPVSAVGVLMGNSNSPDDFLHNGVLEYSADGGTWSSLGSFTNNSDVQAQPATPVQARYLRLRSTAAQSNWLVVDEFAVTVVPAATALTNLPTYQSYGPANLADGDPSTWFWSNGAPPVDGYAGLDLGSVRPIGAVDVVMGSASSQSDYLHAGVLESSPDGTKWTTLTTFSGHNEVTVTAPAGTTARYVRIRGTASQTYWLVLDDFLVW